MIEAKNWIREAHELSEEEVWMPALFLGHGNPMNAIADNSYTRALQKAGTELPKPKAILVISAHWLSRGTWVSTAAKPEMIYDMYGFPDELYKVQYPSPGAPDLAKETATLLAAQKAQEDPGRGLDHGVWSVLKHLFPRADIPVYTLSIDWGKSTAELYAIGQALVDLRKRGVLIVGSGNITHNLGNFSWEEKAKPYDWAVEFDTKIKEWLEAGDHQSLMNYTKLGAVAKMAHPSNDHYLPLMFTIGAQRKNDPVTMIFDEMYNGSLSMRCVKFG